MYSNLQNSLDLLHAREVHTTEHTTEHFHEYEIEGNILNYILTL